MIEMKRRDRKIKTVKKDRKYRDKIRYKGGRVQKINIKKKSKSNLNPILKYLASTEECELGPPWLLWLCVVFGILFLIMLCVNIFLCSAMTCSISKTDTEPEEKAGSVFTVQVKSGFCLMGLFRYLSKDERYHLPTSSKVSLTFLYQNSAQLKRLYIKKKKFS